MDKISSALACFDSFPWSQCVDIPSHNNYVVSVIALFVKFFCIICYSHYTYIVDNSSTCKLCFIRIWNVFANLALNCIYFTIVLLIKDKKDKLDSPLFIQYLSIARTSLKQNLVSQILRTKLYAPRIAFAAQLVVNVSKFLDKWSNLCFQIR